MSVQSLMVNVAVRMTFTLFALCLSFENARSGGLSLKGVHVVLTFLILIALSGDL
jgi:hypothetical protein